MLHACREFKALEIMGQLTDLSLLISIFFFYLTGYIYDKMSVRVCMTEGENICGHDSD